MTTHSDPHGDPETYAPDPRPMMAWARRVLDEAWGELQKEGVAPPDVRVSKAEVKIQAAAAMATLAQAAAILQPTPEEVLEAYEGVAVEVDEGAASKLQEVHAILDEARRKGPRHPAISAALKVLEASEGR